MMRLRLAAPSLVVLLATVLGGCGKSTASAPGFFLNEPTAVAAFRGFTTKTAELHTYFAVANASGNDLTIIDGADDSLVPAPVPLRPLVFPVPDRPALLASASLNDGDDKADLLVVVAAGDSRLQVISTWDPAGAVTAALDLGGDVLALVSLGSPGVGQARMAAALSDGRIAVAYFSRVPGQTAIDVSTATVQVVRLGYQPVALAAVPGDPAMVYAATADPILEGPFGVAEIQIDASGVPTTIAALNAHAPTRLVAAADLWDASSASTSLDKEAFDLLAPKARRVYAILDERFCGRDFPIACGLVAIDQATQDLLPDPDPIGTAPVPGMHAPFRAPIAVPGAALAIAAAQPPAVAPVDAPDPNYGGTLVRMVTAAGVRWTTATAAVASTDGSLYFVDPARWELPGEQVVQPTATLVANPDPDVFTTAFTTAMRFTAGYTPTARWTATYQGELPGMTLRRAESVGTTLALQATSVVGHEEVVRVFDPRLGIEVGDVAVIADPSAVGSCAPTFEATVAALLPPTADHPGGALQLAPIFDPAEWGTCLANLAGTPNLNLRATIRAGGWILFRGTGPSAVQVGRPEVDAEFAIQWQTEDPTACPTWSLPFPSWSCDATCRDSCARLIRARLARRIGYVPSQGNWQGPALAFTLPLNAGVKRGLAVIVDTNEGRGPFHASASVTAVDARAVVPFDRSRIDPASGVRFLVPYTTGVVLDATPTVQGGGPVSLH